MLLIFNKCGYIIWDRIVMKERENKKTQKKVFNCNVVVNRTENRNVERIWCKTSLCKNQIIKKSEKKEREKNLMLFSNLVLFIKMVLTYVSFPRKKSQLFLLFCCLFGSVSSFFAFVTELVWCYFQFYEYIWARDLTL